MPTNSNGMSDGKGQINHQCQETGHGYPSNWKNMPKEQLQPNDRIERPVAPVGSYSAMLQAQRNRKDYSNAQPPRSGDPFSTGQQPNSYHTQDVTPKHIMQKDPNHGQVPAATRFPDVYMQPPRPFPNNKLPSLQTNGALIETCQALYAAKIISVRWRDELERLRGLPAHMCMFVNNIVIPAADKDRVYISYHSTGPSILGHLRDGTEVSVRLMHPSAARVSPDLANKLLNMDESEHFILKYKDFVYSDGLLYVASELHEYTLTEFLVRERNTDDTYRQRMLFQLLRGIKRLHQDHLCVHGELRPDNVLFDVNWTVKLAGYGLGRNREGPTVDYSEDDMCWLPPEVLVHKKQVNFKSDIFATGMLIYYILRNCRNPFGSSPAEILRNIEASSPQVEAVSDEAADLLATMLSINKIERPSINNTLDHPCFWGEEKKFRFINIVGSDVVYELKHGLDKRESMIDILCNVKNTTKFCKWMEVIEPHLLRDMTVYRQYKNTLLDLVLFVHNYCAHTDKLSERSQRAVDEPCSYFLSRFPSLFMAVYRAIKRSGKRHKTCYAPFF
ncbi:hypothetical protein DPMN_171386 [Dreissena polymorpha]|uniref:Protein kinase domain-containing protein n=2 Tax=Dreissena polymorpha TaxID=45954 RepID=A0A9D4ICD2_DREPO|nr:hypothetical protein DPMN_171386 [Dreissena polymorpha]